MRDVRVDIGSMNTLVKYVLPAFVKDSVGQEIEDTANNVETEMWVNLTYQSTGGSNAERKIDSAIETSFNAGSIVLRYGLATITERGYFKMSTNIDTNTDYQIWDIENISYYPSITRPQYIICLCRNRE